MPYRGDIGLRPEPRQRPLHKAEGQPSFRDLRGTLTEEALKKETARCLGCGAAVVDPETCLGCGQCVVSCTFEAIRLDRVRDVVGTTFEKLPLKLAPYALKRAARIAGRTAREVFAGRRD